ncbi:MAG: polysaccharide biosynthesis/export family protein [Prevotella sp.]|nr:polysaccharide biosynthesis/export family protein [Prevotella sp.]
MNIRHLFQTATLLAVMVLASCTTPKNVVYFQDIKGGENVFANAATDIRLQKGDKVSIIVKTKDAQLTNLFNLPVTSQILGQTKEQSMLTPSGTSGYTVDAGGNIDFPIVGSIPVAGKTRQEVAATIKDALIGNGLTKDAVVTVEFLNLHFTVMGEVKNPGPYSFDHDRVSIIDALGKAGDMTIYGQRDSVIVFRQEGDLQKAYVVNLCNANAIMSSPVYFMQQNDVIYVKPNKSRMRQATVNGNETRSPSFWISLTSVLTTLAVVLFK